jgi:hypothetical protein
MTNVLRARQSELWRRICETRPAATGIDRTGIDSDGNAFDEPFPVGPDSAHSRSRAATCPCQPAAMYLCARSETRQVRRPLSCRVSTAPALPDW